MEAGLEHLSWAGGTLRHVDLLLVVVNPTAKSLLTARRTITLAGQLGIPRVALVANRAAPDDFDRLAGFAADHGAELIAVIPDDDAVAFADRIGGCALDHAPEADAVRAIERLATELEARFLTP